MVYGKPMTNEEKFTSWLAERVSPAQLSELYVAFHEMEKIFQRFNLLYGSFFDNVDIAKAKELRSALTTRVTFRLFYKKRAGIYAAALGHYIDFLQEQENDPPARDIAPVETTESESAAPPLFAHEQTAKPMAPRIPETKPQQKNLRMYWNKPLLNDFTDWMLRGGASPATTRNYASGLLTAERYATGHGFAHHTLLTEESEQSSATAAELLSDEAFRAYNRANHNRFSAAIRKWLEYLHRDMPEATPVVPKPPADIPEALRRDVQALLREHFAYGMKIDSYRETSRLRLLAEQAGVALPEDDGALREALLACGTLVDDKLYCEREDMPQTLQRLVADAFATGAEALFYACLYEQNEPWMRRNAITSPELLQLFLQAHMPSYYYGKALMTRGKRLSMTQAVTAELHRVWGKRQTRAIDELTDLLPYIPPDRVKSALLAGDDFIAAAEGSFLLLDRFRITDAEKRDIAAAVDEACREHGYASLNDLPTDAIEEENYELPRYTVQRAAYRTALADRFTLNGKILTKGEEELNGVVLLKGYLRDKDTCTVDEALAKMQELTGSAKRPYTFKALYDDMVRVSREKFVAAKSVHFDVAETDQAIAPFLRDGFGAVRDVTTFSPFPLCGQSWNAYVLESFCWKYSERYRLRVYAFNDKNAGILVEKDNKAPYEELLAMALARSSAPLTAEGAARYLAEAGYLVTGRYAKMPEVLRRASALREGT